MRLDFNNIQADLYVDANVQDFLPEKHGHVSVKIWTDIFLNFGDVPIF